jgi:hypothetical protein
MCSWSGPVRGIARRSARATWGPRRSRNRPSPVTATNVGGRGILGHPTPVGATKRSGESIDTVGVTGSIPVSPTTYRPRFPGPVAVSGAGSRSPGEASGLIGATREFRRSASRLPRRRRDRRQTGRRRCTSASQRSHARPDDQARDHAHAQALRERLGYVAGEGLSAGGYAAHADSGYITQRRIAWSVHHHDQKGRFSWRQQAFARHQSG